MAVDNFARALAAKAIAGGGAGSSSSGSSGSGVQVQADCNIVDETNPAFIKNKPWEMGYQTVFTQDALDSYSEVAPDPTGKFVPGIYAQIQITSVPLVKDKTYYVKCSSDQGIVEYTGKATEVQDGSIALGDVDFYAEVPSTGKESVGIMMNAEFSEAAIMILFNNLASANESDVPTLTNISLIIQEVTVAKKIPSDYIDIPKNNQIQADWNATEETDPSFIKNKPNIVQSDWNTADESNPSFIKNKPFGDDIVTIFRKDSLDKYQDHVVDFGVNDSYMPAILFNPEQNELTLVEGETYHVKCSSDQGTVEYTGKVMLVDGGLALGDYILENGSHSDNRTVDIFIGDQSRIEIVFRNLKVYTVGAVPTLTNVSISIEKIGIKKIPSRFLEASDIQADWNITDSTLPSFIKNKPTTVYMIYKSKYDNGDYNSDGNITGKPIYEAILNGSVIYYVDDSGASYVRNTYYPMTSILISQPCGGKGFYITCTYTSWEYDTSSTTYVCTRNALDMSFFNT